MNTDDALLRRGLLLEYITLGWNVVGVVVVIYAAIKAHSVALAGFGLDSLIEIGASIVVVWELTGSGKGREKRALRLIGTAFFALAVYILVQSARTLALHVRPDSSPLGMIWLGITCSVMAALARGKRITGTKLSNPVLVTEGRVTMVDAYLAASVLVGLALNALVGWWWADPLAGLVIVFYGVKEGLHSWADAR
ncbi:MAG: cation transporter [Chloroflexi bacterium]|nr:cation transporter [Chloroflexota bacterium]